MRSLVVTDDHGDSVLVSIEYGVLWPDEYRVYPNYYPLMKGVKYRPIEYDYQSEVKVFEEFEMNCNTCKHLQRAKQDGDKPKWYRGLHGVCTKKDIDIWFYPEDHMSQVNNDCYENRRTSE